MKIFEKEEFTRNLELTRRNYLQIKSEYNNYLALLDKAESIYEFSEAEKIINAVSESLELVNELKGHLSGINSIKRNVESMRLQLSKVEEKLTNLANGFLKYWNSDVSDIERDDYTEKMGMVAAEHKALLTQISKVEDIIIFLEKEKNSEAAEELNAIIDFYLQVQKTINIIIKSNKENDNTKFNANDDIKSEVIKKDTTEEEAEEVYIINAFDDIKSSRKKFFRSKRKK